MQGPNTLRAIFTFLLASATLFQLSFFCTTTKADNHLAGETGGLFLPSNSGKVAWLLFILICDTGLGWVGHNSFRG